jgi:alkylation response protein AidB-like acyl-CoA dehydrogenase
MALPALPRAPFEITPEQEEIRRLCRDFAANEIRPVSRAVDEADTEVPWDVWNRAAAIGLTSYATQYARERVQFGKPIAEHQAVSFRLADMALRVDASRLLVWRAAKLIDAGQRATTEAAMAKLHASETAMWCTWAALQTLGGWGYSREHPVEKWMRDAKLEEIEEGTSDIQRLVIARGLVRD